MILIRLIKSFILNASLNTPKVQKNYSIPVLSPMSKTFRSFLIVFATSVLILQLFNNSKGQDIEAKIAIDANSPSVARVEGRYVNDPAGRNLSFLLNYADTGGIGKRVSDVRLADRDGKPVNVQRLIEGEFLAKGDFISWWYQIDLTPLEHFSAAAHLSWLTNDGGIVMLDDLLPQTSGGKRSAMVTFELPAGWMVTTTERKTATKMFNVANIEKAVFYVGSDRREKDLQADRSHNKLNISGEWLFTDDEATAMAASVFNEYEQIFGSSPSNEFMIGIRRFPNPVSVGNWEADTRGNNITIISSDMPFKTQSLQRLHEQLRHEIFHLWIPNGVNLTGNYDWFYEGFVLYQSLKIGVAVNRISFDDMLDTLSRAYDIDRMLSQKLSLIDASKNRWNGSNTQVYARGMLVAFLCDLALLEKSKGKRSITDLLRELYQSHRPPNPAQDGNNVVLGLLRSHSELTTIVERNITGTEAVDWNTLLKSAGLETVSSDQTTKLKVASKPNGSQKDLLDKLGYNNWRKKSGN